jgi:serine/threonine protein kinase
MVGDDSHAVHLLDFGLSRHYRTAQHCFNTSKGQKMSSFAGAVFYCSIRAHFTTYTALGDMEALAYVLIELACGSLPWKNLRRRDFCDKDDFHDAILGKKLEVDTLNKFVRDKCHDHRLAEALIGLLKYCRPANANCYVGACGQKAPEQEPDYEQLRRILNGAKPVAHHLPSFASGQSDTAPEGLRCDGLDNTGPVSPANRRITPGSQSDRSSIKATKAQPSFHLGDAPSCAVATQECNMQQGRAIPLTAKPSPVKAAKGPHRESGAP